MDVFFALSGFLITSLLVVELQNHRHIDLKRFWVRRARRLAPGLILVLLAVAAYLHFSVAAVDRGAQRDDALAAVFYVANWRFIATGQDYFAHFATPSPVLHLWSLAVEEQFYLLWPLIVLAVCAIRARRAQRGQRDPRAGGPVPAGVAAPGEGGVSVERTVAIVALAGAAASVATILILAARGADASRMYYGTDTRAQCLLVGAALGAARLGPGWRVPPRLRRLLEIAGILALAGLVAAWHTVDTDSRWLYSRGGLLGVVLLTAVLITAVSEAPHGPLARLLSVRLLRYLGALSYLLYLWHWPVYLWLNHARTGLSGPLLLAVRLVVTLLVSAASYHLIAEPIRAGRFRLPRPRLAVPALAGVVVAVIMWGGASPVASQAATIVGYNQAGGQDPPPLAPPRAASPAVEQHRPVRVLLVGDSLALTLGGAISDAAPAYGVSLYDAGWVGCGVAVGGPIRYSGTEHEQLQRCATWPVVRAAEVAQFDPDVVVQLVGRWDILDRVYAGRWTHVGDPEFDAYLRAQLNRSVDVLSARGAKVLFLTTPCFQGQERPDGGTWPEDDPGRVSAFNDLLAQVATDRAGQVELVDFASLVCPGGRYTSAIRATPVRSDGVHIASGAGAVLAQPLLSRFAEVGAVRRDSLPPTPGPQPTPGRPELPVTPRERWAAGLPG